MVNGLQVRFRVFPVIHLVLYKKACASCTVHDAMYVQTRAENRYIHHYFTFNFRCMAGTSLMTVIVAEMQVQGYYAHIRLAKSSVIQTLTVLGLKSSHEYRHGV